MLSKKTQTMSVIEHLAELRRRLIIILAFLVVTSVACFPYAGQMLEILSRGQNLIYIRPAEAMLAHIRLAVTAGAMCSTPVVFYQVIAFLIPALTKREKRVVIAATVLMLFLFMAGLSFAWLVVFPFALNFFANFATEQLFPWYTVSEYVSFATGFLLAFGLVFQLPLVFWVLGSLGIVTSRILRAGRKYTVLIIAILSALLTPPDIVSQILMIVPMMILFEFGIVLVALVERRRKKMQEGQ